ncbi:MAG TPA: Crp/Fnr family transcriptional regulator [Candidatus Kapabacteria bacterium]|nr:Crp/Fnr family transcriptional regulator [Candidatus Kapabacteria bacterium]
MKDKFILDEAVYRTIPLFSEMNKKEFGSVLSYSVVKRYKKNAAIFFDGDEYTGLYIVLKGSVKVYKNSPDGKEYVVHLLRPYALFADVPMFEGGNYPANAQALESTDLLFIPKKQFLECLDSSPALMKKMLVGFAKKIRTLSLQLEDLTLHDVTCRLARLLIHLAEEKNRQNLPQPFVRLSAQKSVVAAQIGTVIETLSRSLKKMQDDSIIEVKGSTITILDYPRLRALAEYRA